MAYVKIGTHSGKRKGVKTYIGASGDTKPSSGLSVGSKCYEYDTKNWYITHNDGTTWTALVDLTGMVSDIDELTLEAEHLSCIFPDYASDIDLTCTLTSGAIDTFGSWAEIVDSDGTKLSACCATKEMHISAVRTRTTSVEDVLYFIEKAYGPDSAHLTMVNDHLVGSGAKKLASEEQINIRPPVIPAGSLIWYRMKTENNANATSTVCIRYHTH